MPAAQGRAIIGSGFTGGGGGGSGTVESVTNSDGTITVTGTPTVAPVVSRAAITGDVSIAAGSSASTVNKIQGTSIAAPPGGTTEFLRGDGTWQVPAGGEGGGVSSFGSGLRTGAVVLQPSDLIDAFPAAVNGQGIVFNGSLWVPRAMVSSFNGRAPSAAGAITPATGDYTAAQVGALPSTDDLSAIATANPTAASVPMNAQKITGLLNGSGLQDAAAFGQIPTALPPNGAAGGDLSGTYPNPALAAIGSATGPFGSSSVAPIVTIDAKGRVTALTSATITPAAIGAQATGVAAGGDLSGTYPNPSVAKVNGTSVPATPSAGQALIASSGTAAAWGYFGLISVTGQPASGAVPLTAGSFVSNGLALALTIGTWLVFATGSLTGVTAVSNVIMKLAASTSGGFVGTVNGSGIESPTSAAAATVTICLVMAQIVVTTAGTVTLNIEPVTGTLGTLTTGNAGSQVGVATRVA